MGDEKTPPSWWTTLPGVITALAGLLTAVGGLVLVLNKAGVIGTAKNADGNPPAVTSTLQTGTKDQEISKTPRKAKVEGGSQAQIIEATTNRAEPRRPASNWTHTVRIRDLIFEYNSADGSAEVLRDGVVLRSYSPGDFSSGWTNIVPTPYGTLFYNRQTGHGSVVRFDNNGNGSTIKAYPSPGSPAFAAGWTDISFTRQGIEFNNAATGAHALGEIDSAGNFRTIRSR